MPLPLIKPIPPPTTYGGQISQERLNYLWDKYNEGGIEEAVITHKDDVWFYITELEDIGVSYIMDDFGNAVRVTMEMWQQHFEITSYHGVLT